MAADPVLCETSPDSPVQVYEYVVATPIVFIMCLCVDLGVSINFVGWRNRSKIERGVSHCGTIASTAPKMPIKFRKGSQTMPGHPLEPHPFQRQLLLLLW